MSSSAPNRRKSVAERTIDESSSAPKTFSQEVRRALTWFVCSYVLGTLVVTAVHFRLLVDKTNDTIDDTALIAGILCGMAGPFLVYMATDHGESSNLIDRSRGLVPVALLVVAIQSLLAPVGLALWSPIIGADAAYGSVYDVVPTSPLAWVLVVALAWCCFAWGYAFCVPFFAANVDMKLRLILFLPLWLVSFFVLPFLAHKVLGGPPSAGLALALGGVAVVLTVVMVLVLWFVGRFNAVAEYEQSVPRAPSWTGDERRPG
ncbi:hypothetical protein [Janibacter corallicola]|uniref:hypothetical protein n=1 Tax=Janibacter corallicola TaxID=415212 RepID=UPI0012EDD520|nr:hypothetical protein [Janibacter corallicola]